MGFSETWMQWMMLCVNLVNYSALMNFEKVDPIRSVKRLRQARKSKEKKCTKELYN
jgi:hypothetical protein